MASFSAIYGFSLRIYYAFQAALRAVGAAGGGWALLAALRAIGFGLRSEVKKSDRDALDECCDDNLVVPRQPGQNALWICWTIFNAQKR